MWAELYPGASGELEDSLTDGPVVVTGPPGACRAEVAAEALSDLSVRRTIEIQAVTTPNATGLRQSLLGMVVPDPRAAEFEDRQAYERAVAELFGARAQEAIRAKQAGDGDAFTFAELFAAVGGTEAILVHDAHLLAEPWAENVLWALRARAQEPGRPQVVLLTRPWHTDALVSREAPFLGFARVLELWKPGVPEWSSVTEGVIAPEALPQLLDLTRRHPRPTLAVLSRLDPKPARPHGWKEVFSAWSEQVDASHSAAVATVYLVRGLHQFAPRLLTALASGYKVYASVPNARTDAIATALRLMRDHDVVYQPRPRQWLVSNPALVPHLAAARMP
jgi:hypothetical protein